MKSQDQAVKSYLKLFACLLVDAGQMCGVDLSRDFTEIVNRTTCEGLSFLTRTLPRFDKHVLSMLEGGCFTPISGFKHSHRKGPLPYFLKGLVLQLFTEDGSLCDDPNPDALFCIQTICTFMYKTRFGFSDSAKEKRFKSFVETERAILNYVEVGDWDLEKTYDNAIMLGLEVFRDFEVTEMPRMGPGAVAGGEKLLDKANFDFIDRVDEMFTWEDWFSPVLYMPENGQEESVLPCWFGTDKMLLPGSELRPARAVCVEKDSRGPRLISCEPKELQWVQQAIGRSIMGHLESHTLTRGHINFTHQSVNQSLALRASGDGEFATLDLEDASDRVSLALCRLILPTALMRRLEACRSESTELDGITVDLKKFAPMGSACCFPVESFVFWLLIVARIAQVTGMDYWRCSRHVYVYGDDIIVTSRFAEEAVVVLESAGLKVNMNKSFMHGPFRESCGCDALNGVDVTAVKLRAQIPTSKRDVSAIVSLVATANLLYKRGMWSAAAEIKSIVESLIGPLPIVPEDSPLLGWLSFSARGYIPFGCKVRWDNDTMQTVLRGYGVEKKAEEPDPTALSELILPLARSPREPVRYGLDEIQEGSSIVFRSERKLRLKRRWVPFWA